MIQESEYKERRDRIAKRLEKNSIAVLFSSEHKTRSNDTHYPFRQNSNFYYLSGFKEDSSALLFVKTNKSVKTILFVHKKDEKLELWNGKRLGEKEAKKHFLVDEVYVIDEFEAKFKELSKNRATLYCDLDSKDKRVKNLKKIVKNSVEFKNIFSLISNMRLVKSKAEIRLIKKAIEITKKAHHSAMKSKKSSKK